MKESSTVGNRRELFPRPTRTGRRTSARCREKMSRAQRLRCALAPLGKREDIPVPTGEIGLIIAVGRQGGESGNDGDDREAGRRHVSLRECVRVGHGERSISMLA